ncbi:hypothetical protein P170DRAFT_129040 [Aspergillus steynii IBT 23096]|uniref:Uncharacterized protein n=1 Tax=Aspergillus steynii IBT 23096 TaxID=1392250 RepID=A0A2I2GKH8_9EURO|nr:uncharacterized protein P170DRAFT_129040 [Aspergillus steynii IBT 23096]PLB53381.1 hypothetical protein P170DRAFT_129040 [Aspergillus steynii IBT 23096]
MRSSDRSIVLSSLARVVGLGRAPLCPASLPLCSPSPVPTHISYCFLQGSKFESGHRDGPMVGKANRRSLAGSSDLNHEHQRVWSLQRLHHGLIEWMDARVAIAG